MTVEDGPAERASLTTDLTGLLQEVGEGSRDAMDRVFKVVYEELLTLAKAQRARWSGNETLDTTALLHESYLKLVRADRVLARDRGHFFTLASRAMRQVLVNYARDQRAEKRGGGQSRHPIDSLEGLAPLPVLAAEQLIELDRALDDLAFHSQRSAAVVECRFFAGLSVHETAEALGTSAATVKRDWAYASRWLRERLEPSALRIAGEEGGGGEEGNVSHEPRPPVSV